VVQQVVQRVVYTVGDPVGGPVGGSVDGSVGGLQRISYNTHDSLVTIAAALAACKSLVSYKTFIVF